MRAELLDAALWLAARGWRVFPLRPGDKRPAIRDWESRATTDPDRIHRGWASGGWNVGVACGPSGLVVVDLDTPKDGAEPPPRWRQPGIGDGMDVLAALAETHRAPLPVQTYTVRTAGGGEHLYFAAPDRLELRNTAGRLGWLIDTRAHDGYVVGAGSRVHGRTYVEFLDLPVAPLPDWITRLLRVEPAPPDTVERVAAVARRSRYVASALCGELDRVLAAIPRDPQPHPQRRGVRARAAHRRRAAARRPRPRRADRRRRGDRAPTRGGGRNDLLRAGRRRPSAAAPADQELS